MRGFRSRRVSLATLAAVASVVILPPAPALACSICRCGDATFNALGKDGYAALGFRAALDWERFDKDEGNPAEESESQVENRYTVLISYGFNDRLALSVRVPYSVRELTSTLADGDSKNIRTSGLSDPEVHAQIRLWASPFASEVGRRVSVSLNAAVKTPWGQNDVQQDGTRVDEHAQPGTGSTDFFGGLAYLYLFDRKSALFASAGYRHTGANDFGYRYGNAYLASVAYEHKLGQTFDGIVELDFRDVAKDRIDSSGALDADTGGSLLYLTPRLLVNLGGGFVLRTAVQIPVVRNLNGFQQERTVFNVGLTYLFSH